MTQVEEAEFEFWDVRKVDIVKDRREWLGNREMRGRRGERRNGKKIGSCVPIDLISCEERVLT